MKGSKKPTLHDVAKRAGVSAMTVSRVLRNSPRVLPATRAKVKKILRSLSYEPDPQMSRLMTLVRNRKSPSLRTVIAVIRSGISNNELLDPAYQYVSIKDIQKRAAQYGCVAEEFFVSGERGVSPRRLTAILEARGIECMIVTPQSTQHDISEIDYSKFSVSTFGYGLSHPSLHRISTNMTQGILMAIEELEKRGYKRIGLAITQWINARADNTYSGAMLHYQQSIPEDRRVPVLLFHENNLASGEKIFCDWILKEKPDVIISFDMYVLGWLEKMKLRIPEDIGLVVHDWSERMTGLAGIHHRRPEVAAAAVDVVIRQLLQNERGVPEVARQILIPPMWVDGKSI